MCAKNVPLHPGSEWLGAHFPTHALPPLLRAANMSLPRRSGWEGDALVQLLVKGAWEPKYVSASENKFFI